MTSLHSGSLCSDNLGHSIFSFYTFSRSWTSPWFSFYPFTWFFPVGQGPYRCYITFLYTKPAVLTSGSFSWFLLFPRETGPHHAKPSSPTLSLCFYSWFCLTQSNQGQESFSSKSFWPESAKEQVAAMAESTGWSNGLLGCTGGQNKII